MEDLKKYAQTDKNDEAKFNEQKQKIVGKKDKEISLKLNKEILYKII